MRKHTPPFSPEVRERAVRMVREHEGEHGSQWAAIQSIAAKIGCSGESLRTGCASPNGIKACGQGRPRPSASASRRWSARSVNCAKPTNPEEGQCVFRHGGARPPVADMIAFIDDHRRSTGSSRSAGAADRPVDLLRARPRGVPFPRSNQLAPQRCRADGRDPARFTRRPSVSTACARSGGNSPERGSWPPAARWRG